MPAATLHLRAKQLKTCFHPLRPSEEIRNEWIKFICDGNVPTAVKLSHIYVHYSIEQVSFRIQPLRYDVLLVVKIELHWPFLGNIHLHIKLSVPTFTNLVTSNYIPKMWYSSFWNANRYKYSKDYFLHQKSETASLHCGSGGLTEAEQLVCRNWRLLLFPLQTIGHMKKTGFREILWMTVEERGSNYLQLAPPPPRPHLWLNWILSRWRGWWAPGLGFGTVHFTDRAPIWTLLSGFFVGRKIRANIAFCELNFMHTS